MNPALDKKIPKEELIPVIETDLFQEAPQAKFWVGEVAAMGVVAYPKEFLGARQLRANVYIDAEGFLPESAREPDGGETDEDDNRSVHFAVLENEEGGVVRVVGTSRLITRDSEELPVERMYPEFFTSPEPMGSVEASRYISRHESSSRERLVSLALIRSMVASAVETDAQHIYAVVEEPLRQSFDRTGLVKKSISEPKNLEEYGDTSNVAIRYNPREIFNMIRTSTNGSSRPWLAEFLKERDNNQTLGYYDKNLTDMVR